MAEVNDLKKLEARLDQAGHDIHEALVHFIGSEGRMTVVSAHLSGTVEIALAAVKAAHDRVVQQIALQQKTS